MTFDLQRILESKRVYRRALAARPIAEKLRMLDALRERTLAILAAKPPTAERGVVGEDPGRCRTPRRSGNGR